MCGSEDGWEDYTFIYEAVSACAGATFAETLSRITIDKCQSDKLDKESEDVYKAEVTFDLLKECRKFLTNLDKWVKEGNVKVEYNTNSIIINYDIYGIDFTVNNDGSLTIIKFKTNAKEMTDKFTLKPPENQQKMV